jgi:hypothetical protein
MNVVDSNSQQETLTKAFNIWLVGLPDVEIISFIEFFNAIFLDLPAALTVFCQSLSKNELQLQWIKIVQPLQLNGLHCLWAIAGRFIIDYKS